MGDLRLRSSNSLPLDQIIALPNSSGINEPNGNSTQINYLFDCVSSGACRLADDGSIESEQHIEKARLADIRRSTDYGANAFPKYPPLIGGRDELVDRLPCHVNSTEQRLSGFRIDIFFGKIDVGLHVSHNAYEFLAQSGQRIPQSP